MRIQVIAPSLIMLLFCCTAFLTFSGRPLPQKVPSLPRAGIRTSSEYSVQTLIQDIFVKGGCKNISNIRAIGNPQGIGFFDNGGPVVGLEKGILISTGHIGNAEGPNSDTDKSGDFGDGSGDPYLSGLASARVFDAVGIEFDFVPLDSIVTFRYVFASEEYCEYVGSKFNDVFGFFISGPGINGPFAGNAANVALIPGTGDYVSINSVNHRRNSEYYVGNELEADARTCGTTAAANPLHPLIEYDGFTKGLTAVLKLIPCETYRLRLVVGDVSDNLYDSAVFLEAESFNIGGEVTVKAETTIDTSYVLEGCPSGQFTFRRVKTEDVSRDLEIKFVLDSAGTAEEGVDFETLPRSVIIPAGQQTVTLPVTAINDLKQEPPEKILLRLDYPCDCVTGEAAMILADPPDLKVDLADQDICPGEEAILRPAIRGGTREFSFKWSTADTGRMITVRPAVTTAYRLTITDACGQFVEQEVTVRLIEPAKAEISGYENLCPGSAGTLSVRFTGEAPWQFTYTIDGQEQQTFSDIRINPFPLSVRQAGTYQLSAFNDGRCVGIPAGSARVDITQLKIEMVPKGVSCFGLSDGRVDVVVSGGSLPYFYQWDKGQGERKNLQNVPADTYTLRVADAKGCQDTAGTTVPSPPPLEELSFDCLDLGTDSVAFSTGGGSPPYQFSVDGSNFYDASLFGQLDEGKLYNLIIRDDKGCRREQEFLMPANTKTYIDLTPEVTVTLGQKYLFNPQLLIPASLVQSVRWSPRTDLSCETCLQPTLIPQENRTYTLRITDRFGCWDESTIIVNVNRQPSVFIPTAFSPNNDGHNDQFMVFADPDQVSRIRVFQVFNRWGNLMHEVRDVRPNDPATGWDGRFQGKWQDSAVYIYFAEIELVDGSVLMKKGDVLLLR